MDILSDLLLQNDDDATDLSLPHDVEMANNSEMFELETQLEGADRNTRRRAQQVSSARRLRLRNKMELVTLRKENCLLSKQLGVLISNLQHSHSQHWKKLSAVEQRKRLEAEENNERLRRELFQQTSLLRNYRSVFSSTIPYRVDLNMRNFLHSATKLPRTLQARSRCLEAVCTDAKLDLATHILLKETESTRPFTTPSFSWEPLDLGSSAFGITSIAVFALDTASVCRTFEAASNAIVNCAVMWPSYSLMNSSVKQMDMLSTKLDIRYEVSDHRFQSSSSGEKVLLENRDISYGRVDDASSVLVWDFVDEDDVFPLKKTTTVKRSTIGALLVRPEQCDDGVERVVCRYICTKIHVMNTPELPPDIQRFSRSSQLGAKLADSMVYEAIKGVVTLGAM